LLAACYARRALRKKATPLWACEDLIKVVYEKAKLLGMDVDHVVPLRGKTVSGLHTWWNLQLLHPEDNRAKSNKSWPDMPE
jgi:5-methylcytosine-specific restriction endonuclease McrA